MSLSEIKNKLYKKDLEEDLAKHEESEFDARAGAVGTENAGEQAEDKWETEKISWFQEHRDKLKIGAIALGVVVGVVLLLVAVYQVRKATFNEGRVTLAVEGPTEARSGKLLTYEITYNNNNWASLKGAELRISYPESFKPEDSTAYKQESPTVSLVDLGQVKGHGTNKIVLNGKVYSPQGTLMYIKADLIYTPSNFNSQFEAMGQLGVNIISTPITMEVMAPQNIASGDSLDYLISYKNVGEEDFEGLRAKVDYPDGFTFSIAKPAASEGNNTWYIGHLSAGAEGKIVVSGKLEGDRDQIKNVKAYIGTIDQGQFVSYNEEGTATKIVSSPLAIFQTVNGLASLNVGAGTALRFEINYKNDSDLGLRDVIVTENINSPVLDYSTLDMEGGAYNAENKTITWKASDYPALANLGPGKGGVIKFSIKVKDVIPMTTANDKNFVISSVAKIDSPDIPTPIQMNKIIAGNRMDIKLNSKLVLDVKGYHKDLLIENSGPIPPTVGQATTYTIHWDVTNISNDVANAQVVATLPTGVAMTGKTYPEDAGLTYNDRTNTITWNIGNMKAGDGILNSPKEAAFQIKITPSPDQAGKFVDLLNAPTFSAQDLFTGENLTAPGDKKTTLLREDDSVGATGGKVK